MYLCICIYTVSDSASGYPRAFVYCYFIFGTSSERAQLHLTALPRAGTADIPDTQTVRQGMTPQAESTQHKA